MSERWSLAQYRKHAGLGDVEPAKVPGKPATAAPTVIPKKPRSYPERQLQIACVEALTRHVPPPEQGGPWFTAVNPIPAKSKASAGLSKAMGMRAGVPDLLIVHAGKALFVELKRPDGKGRVDPKQREAMAAIEANGCAVAVCRSVPEFVDTLRQHGVPMRMSR